MWHLTDTDMFMSVSLSSLYGKDTDEKKTNYC